MSIFSKSLADIIPEDIRHLVEDDIPEGRQLEFKKTLPWKDEPDPWLQGRDRIGTHARNKLLSEMVAFANAHGGTLIIGIGETEEKPPRAAEIVPLQRCAQLGEKISLCARDCISPQLPELRAQGVEMNGEGAGVVLIRVSRSRLAPHRLEQTRECYIRRNDRCERMTMREIQDVTLNMARMSVEAMWTLRFSRDNEWINGGVLILDGGRMYGGTDHYYYEGRYEFVGNELRAELRCAWYSGSRETPFGDTLERYTARLTGVRTGSRMEGRMEREDRPEDTLHFELTRRANLP